MVGLRKELQRVIELALQGGDLLLRGQRTAALQLHGSLRLGELRAELLGNLVGAEVALQRVVELALQGGDLLLQGELFLVGGVDDDDELNWLVLLAAARALLEH